MEKTGRLYQGIACISGLISQKTQRFYDEKDLVEMFGGVGERKGAYSKILVVNPRYTIGLEELVEAVRFEFGIKYIDRRFNEITERAIKVFTKRWEEIYGKQ